MYDQIAIGWWGGSLLLSILVSAIELSFVASGKIGYIVTHDQSRPNKFILDTIYGNFHRFQAALMLGKVLLLLIFVYWTIQLVNQFTVDLQLNVYVKIILAILVASISLLLAIEILPRILIGKNATRLIKIFLLPAYLCYVLFFPFAVLFERLSKAILRAVGVPSVDTVEDDNFYRVNFDALVEKNGDDQANEVEVDSEVIIFRNALDFSSKKVKDCMIPRADIVAVSMDTSLDKLKELFIESGITRILVFKENLDNIVGYIHMWEIFNNPNEWTQNLAPTSFVPESMQANRLMNDLMQQRKSIAVVVDEFGGTSGIVTMEDLVEEIFGEIEDEYDVESKFVKQEGEHEFVMSGRVEIDHLNEYYHLDLDKADEYSTVAGYLLYHMQRFPKTYETVIIGKYTFKILKVTARKIEVVKLVLNGQSAEELLT